MAIELVLNTELCVAPFNPLHAAVGPNNAVVEILEHAGHGVGEKLCNPAHAAANQAVFLFFLIP